MAQIFFHTLFLCCMRKALSFKEIQNHFQALEFTLFHSRMSTQGQTSIETEISLLREPHTLSIFLLLWAGLDSRALIHLVFQPWQCLAQVLREDSLSLEGLFSSQESWLARFFS